MIFLANLLQWIDILKYVATLNWWIKQDWSYNEILIANEPKCFRCVINILDSWFFESVSTGGSFNKKNFPILKNSSFSKSFKTFFQILQNNLQINWRISEKLINFLPEHFENNLSWNDKV